MSKSKIINVQGFDIALFESNEEDYISLTDIARYKDAKSTDDIIKNWLRNRNTIELLGFWETIYNLNFKPVEFDGFRKQAGLNSFVLSPKKWIETTNAIGIISKSGRHGGTFAHKDIAFDVFQSLSNSYALRIAGFFPALITILVLISVASFLVPFYRNPRNLISLRYWKEMPYSFQLIFGLKDGVYGSSLKHIFD